MSARIEFTQYFLDESYITLTFDDPDGVPNIYKYWDYCRRFAHTLGYDPNKIEEIFRDGIKDQ